MTHEPVDFLLLQLAPSPIPWCSKLSKREPLGHPRLRSPTLLTIAYDTLNLGMIEEF